MFVIVQRMNNSSLYRKFIQICICPLILEFNVLLFVCRTYNVWRFVEYMKKNLGQNIGIIRRIGKETMFVLKKLKPHFKFSIKENRNYCKRNSVSVPKLQGIECPFESHVCLIHRTKRNVPHDYTKPNIFACGEFYIQKEQD